MSIRVKPFGPSPANILLVGEAPGAEEEYRGQPFVGQSGMELARMLHEAGIIQTECRITNVCQIRPPGNDISLFFKDKKGFVPGPEIEEGLKELELEVFRTKPNVIIALGDTALWACTGFRGITAWGGSTLESKWNCKVVPTYHPAGILRVWDWRAITVHDLRRAKKESAFPELRIPEWRFIVRPQFNEVMMTLRFLIQQAERGALPLAVDIETRQGQIACIGLGWSRLDAICIPFLCTERASGYWQLEEEGAIIIELKNLLKHKNVSVTGQNFGYDAQYFAKEFGYIPNLGFDTMVAQHVAFAGMPKSLDFLSRMYCDFHQYWKDEGKLWDPKMPEDRLWVYNCRDCVATFEVREALAETLDTLGLMHIFGFRMRLWKAMLFVMLRGLLVDRVYRSKMAMELVTAATEREDWITKVLGRPLNVRSPKQMHDLFYNCFALSPVLNRVTKRPTLNDDALEKIIAKDITLRPLIRKIQELRSIGVFLSTFVQAPLDSDGRMRCYFNVAGPETYRLSSSENAFGSGTNLQNIPQGGESDPGFIILPNVRKMFIPPPDCTIADIDLAGADAQIVAEEADDEYLRSVFRSGEKLHAVNAKDIFGGSAGADGRKEPYYTRAKVGVHATNYGASARRISEALGITLHEAERFQTRWFEIHPGIKQWHKRVENLLQTRREVRNAFGYRRFYLDRIEGLLPEALAWIPQSTVAHVSEAGLVNIEEFCPLVQVVLQVHDSIVVQYPTVMEENLLRSVRELVRIPVPYPKPLIIEAGVKTSTKSWGDCIERKWPV